MSEIEFPTLSVIVPALNAASTIENCINSVFEQKYPKVFDVTVALGPSSDNTSEVLQRLSNKYSQLQTIQNPAGTTPAALNLAIKSCSGDVIARVDTQSSLPENYLIDSVETLLRTNAANVGGVQSPIGENKTQRIIALAMQSPFGAGPAKFRGHGQEGPTDTVYLGVFKREILEAVGGFDESFIRNQDYELNWRLRKEGHLIWFNPKIVVEYLPRPTLKKLSNQYFQYGAWKRYMLLRNPKSLKLRQLASPTLVVSLIISFTALFFKIYWASFLPISYLALLAIAALKEKPSLCAKDYFRLILAFATMHLSWGIGFIAGRAK